MADNQKNTKIKVTADTNQAKQAVADLDNLIASTQRKIDRAFNAAQGNNNTISNKQLSGAQSGIGQLNDLANELRSQLDQARANTPAGQNSQVTKDVASDLHRVTDALQRIQQQQSSQMNALGNVKVTSSSAFRVDSITDPAGTTTDYRNINISNRLNARNFRSDVNNILSTIRRESNNWNTTVATGKVSYNRYQEYQGSISSQRERITKMNDFFKSDGTIGKFYNDYKGVVSKSNQANKIASSTNATSAQVKYARELQEQVNTMNKTKQVFDELQINLKKASDNLDTLSGEVTGSVEKGKVTVGTDPNSILGQIKKRSFAITRGALAGASGAFTVQAGRGANLRLSSFDDIKSIAYANGSHDNRVLNELGSAGYRWGYSGADMAGFANAYTSSTGNTSGATDVASTWARQSRVTGGNAQSTQALEQAAGNSANLNSSQMSRLGNDITNSIINSGMSGKATQQQQGLAELYQNGAKYGMTASDERNMAGFQASMSKYGSQFQGTQGAQNTMQLASTLGNYNSPGMRMLFSRTNPGRYNGVDGNARMMEDMQNLQRQPWKMRDTLKSATQAFGGDTLRTAAYISEQSGGSVTVDQAKKWITAAQNGDMSKSQFEKYVKKTQKSGKDADDAFNKTGASKLMKYNASLANSAIKASQALDIFTKALAGMQQKHPYLSIFGNAAGVAMGSVGANLIASGISGLLTGGKGGGGVKGALKAGSHLGKFRSVAGTVVSKSRGLLGRGASLIRGSGKLGKVGRVALRGAKAVGRSTSVGDILLGGADLIGAFATTKKGTRARHRAVGSSIGGTAGGILGGAAAGAAAGSVFGGVGAVPGALIGGILGSFGGEKLGGTIGGMFGTTKKARAINKARGQSLNGARKTARKYNNSSHGLHLGKKGLLIGAGLATGAAGLGLLMGGTAHAATRKKKTPQSEEWKILRGYNKMLDHAMRVVQAAKSIKAGGDDSKKDDDSGDPDDTSKAAEKWKKDIKKAAKAMGANPSDEDINKIVSMIQHESGGDPKRVQEVWDQNMAAGNPAQGLLQYIPQTFNTYAVSGHKNIKSGYDQLLALFNDSNWKQDIHYGGGWSPSGHPVKANGGLRFHAQGGSFLANQATQVTGQDIFGEAGTEAYTPLNAGHYADGLANLKDLAGMFGKQVVDQSQLSSQRTTTINPSYNINLTIQGGTDNADSLAQTVANKVREMLKQYDQQQVAINQHAYYGNETSGLFV